MAAMEPSTDKAGSLKKKADASCTSLREPKNGGNERLKLIELKLMVIFRFYVFGGSG